MLFTACRNPDYMLAVHIFFLSVSFVPKSGFYVTLSTFRALPCRIPVIMRRFVVKLVTTSSTRTSLIVYHWNVRISSLRFLSVIEWLISEFRVPSSIDEFMDSMYGVWRTRLGVIGDWNFKDWLTLCRQPAQVLPLQNWCGHITSSVQFISGMYRISQPDSDC